MSWGSGRFSILNVKDLHKSFWIDEILKGFQACEKSSLRVCVLTRYSALWFRIIIMISFMSWGGRIFHIQNSIGLHSFCEDEFVRGFRFWKIKSWDNVSWRDSALWFRIIIRLVLHESGVAGFPVLNSKGLNYFWSIEFVRGFRPAPPPPPPPLSVI